MNKNISSYYTNELNKMDEIRDSIIEHLRKDLKNMGEQGFLYDEDPESDTSVVPIYYITDNGEEVKIYVDKIKVESNDIIKFHDADANAWCYLSLLGDDAIYTLIECIDWK